MFLKNFLRHDEACQRIIKPFKEELVTYLWVVGD